MMLRVTSLLVLLCGLVASSPLWLRPPINAPLVTGKEMDKTYLLPTDLTPTAYEINLIPYLPPAPEGKENFTFDGNVKITFTVEQPTSVIQLHAYDVKITAGTIVVTQVESGTTVSISKWEMPDDNRKDFLIITVATALVQGQEYTLEMDYLGQLNTALEGFYRSSYVDSEGNTKWMAVTQFEQTGARRAFPCWDQPDFKSVFTLNIAHAPEHNVLSNMPMESETNVTEPGIEHWYWTHFPATSVRMSPYLVAFTVSEFESITHPFEDTYRVWSRPGLQTQGAVAIAVSPRLVNYMEQFTSHVYSLPKLDQIAIPDFDAGAMENWGLITYRESSLLFEEGVSSSSNRQRIEATVAHELAHQWFGNIVTTKWWDNIWLNEGFATYFESSSLAGVEPLWQMENQFVHQDMHYVMQTDGLITTHPLQVENVDNPGSTSAAFDTIAYSKGGCVVRFMVNLMGEENFKEGINSYLTDREFADAVPDQLWENLAPYVPDGVLPTGVTFKMVMDTWLTNAGYPVVTFTRKYDEQQSATVSQTRFVTANPEEVELTEKWYIPLTWSTQQIPEFEDLTVRNWLMPGGDLSLAGVAATSKEWVLLNNKQIGYYRVNYDDENWRMLASALHDQMKDIHVINRGQLMDDSLALARAGLLDYTLALDTTGYLMHEAEYHPWAVGLEALGYIDDRLSTATDTRTPYSAYMRMLLGPAYDVVNGFTVTEDDSHILRYKRSLIVRWACEQGIEECNEEAAALFGEWMEHGDHADMYNPIEPDLRSIVYCNGMKNGGQKEFDFLFQRYKNAAASVSEQSTILTALGCSSDEKILNNLLDMSITPDSGIRTQDSRSVHTSVYANYWGVQVALDFIIDNYQECYAAYGEWYDVSRSFKGVAGKCNTEKQKKQLEELLASPPTPLDPILMKGIEDSVKAVDENLEWLNMHKSHVVDYFKKNAPSSGMRVSVVSPFMLVITLALSSLVAKF